MSIASLPPLRLQGPEPGDTERPSHATLAAPSSSSVVPQCSLVLYTLAVAVCVGTLPTLHRKILFPVVCPHFADHFSVSLPVPLQQ